MAYNKPGIEITQVQKTVSPNLIAPDLNAVVIGPAYQVVNLTDYAYPSYANGTGTTVNLSGLTGWTYLDKDSVYVDLYMASGINAGSRLHVPPASITASDGGTTVQIASSMGIAYDGATIYVGYRAMKLDQANFLTFQTVTDIIASHGTNGLSTLNLLGVGLKLALDNAQTVVYGFGVKADSYTGLIGSGTLSSEHTAAMSVLETQEVYALAPLVNDNSVLASYKAHVLAQSVATAKRERILIQGPDLPWVTAGGVPTTFDLADKAATSRVVRDNNAAIATKRVYSLFPDIIYVRDTRHISTLTSTYITNIHGDGTVYPKLASNVTLSSNHPTVALQGKVYYAGTTVDSTVQANLALDPSLYMFDVYIPLPGSLAAAAVAGQISGNFPEQPLTNLSIASVSSVKFSNDWFTESQLNTMATGGTYILIQPTPSSVLTCRHQLSTDMSSVQTRELSITKSLDYTAKFIRNSVIQYIGRQTISPQFLTILSTSINGLGTSLVKDGRLNGFKLDSLVQDTVNLDTVKAAIEVQPKYPVNYIKIDLIF